MRQPDTTDRTRRHVWAALGASAATLGAIAARFLLPGLPAGQAYTRGFATPWITALAPTSGVGIALLALSRLRLCGPWWRHVLGLAWVACAALLWSAAGLVFDVLQVAAVLGIPGLPPVVDWPGLASRAAALAALAAVAVTARSLQPASSPERPARRRERRWYGCAAVILSLPYPLLKVYWALGGTLGWQPGWPRHMAAGEMLALVALVALSLALVQSWGRFVPRLLLLVAGWGVSAALLTTGALVAFGTIAQALEVVSRPVGFDPGAWVVYLAYGDWLLLGGALGAATWTYQERRRPSDQHSARPPARRPSGQQPRLGR